MTRKLSAGLQIGLAAAAVIAGPAGAPAGVVVTLGMATIAAFVLLRRAGRP